MSVGVVPAAGRLNASLVPDTAPLEARLRLAPHEREVEVRVYIDRFIGEGKCSSYT